MRKKLPTYRGPQTQLGILVGFTMAVNGLVRLQFAEFLQGAE